MVVMRDLKGSKKAYNGNWLVYHKILHVFLFVIDDLLLVKVG
jgi:hypothetical protein